MIGPSLPPRSQAAYDRTCKWSKSYYSTWAARVRVEREAQELAGSIPDEMMNDLSDSEDERTMAHIYRHVPTPPSMPSSPVLPSARKAVPPNTSIRTTPATRGYCWQHSMYSPVDTDGDSSDSATHWQSATWSKSHRSASRRASDLIEQTSPSSPSMMARTRASPNGRFFQLTSSDAKKAASKKHMRKVSPRQQQSSSLVRKRSDSNLRHVRRGRIAKRQSFHRDLD